MKSELQAYQLELEEGAETSLVTFKKKIHSPMNKYIPSKMSSKHDVTVTIGWQDSTLPVFADFALRKHLTQAKTITQFIRGSRRGGGQGP